MSDKIKLGHGSGGRMTHDLIHNHFAGRFGMQGPMTDSAVLEAEGAVIAFTTDSYVVEPLFFPGGDIGKLAVCGTVNDLAVSGARPLYISVSLVIEEGFGLDELDMIISSMAAEARAAGIKIVTGDTKVVGKGKCDGLFINTSGIGVMNRKHLHIGKGTKVSEGDSLIVSGPPGDHAATILALRSNLSFDAPLISDCAALNHMTGRLLEQTDGINFMRDITRGGLAAVLNELASMRGCGITVDESAIPLREEVRGMCEILGFDPLTMACEGRMVVVASPGDMETVLEVMHSFPEGDGAAVIGVITGERKGSVILNTTGGGQRFMEMPSGLLLPRIC